MTNGETVALLALAAYIVTQVSRHQRKWSDQKRGNAYAKRQATRFAADYFGGPGRPDLIRGKEIAEVKNWSRPVYSTAIRKAYEDGNNTFISRSGYTRPAILLADSLGMNLLRGK